MKVRVRFDERQRPVAYVDAPKEQVLDLPELPRMDERVVFRVNHAELVYEVYNVEHLVAAPSGTVAVVYLQRIEHRGPPRKDFRA